MLRDEQILAELRQAVAEAQLAPANLDVVPDRLSFRDRAANGVFFLLARFAALLPQGLGYAVFARLGQIIGSILPKARRDLTRRLSYAFPKASAREMGHIRARFWRNFGQTFFEFLDHERFLKTLEARVDLVGVEHVQRALEAGKPLVLIHCHLANWELLVPTLYGLTGRPSSAIYAPLSVPQLHRRVLHRRLTMGLRPFPRAMRGAMRAMVNGLKEGTPAFITLDQRVPGIMHPFFGEPASTTIIPLEVAIAQGAHLIPIQVERTGPRGTFRMTFHANILPDPVPEGLTALPVLEAYNAKLESWIRHKPEDWFWLHDRWEAV